MAGALDKHKILTELESNIEREEDDEENENEEYDRESLFRSR